MNIKINEKREKILFKVQEIVNNLDYKNLDYFDIYCEKFLELNIQKYIKKNEQKTNNKIELKTICDEYIENYIDHYYYYNTSNIYFFYDKVDYTFIKEDDLLYTILFNIQKDYSLLSTNNKIAIKKNILKKIKNNTCLEIVPESITIQNVLNFLTPIIFEERTYSKYFLTFIGDLILKKNKEEKCFILNTNPEITEFLIQVNKYINCFFHSINIFKFVKLKFYNHETNNANILFLNMNINDSYIKKDLTFFITFLFICVYHSNKYENSINYLNTIINTNEYKYITQLKNIKIEELIKQFWDDSIIIKKNTTLGDNSILFLWKKFLTKNKLPKYLLFQQKFMYNFNKIYENKTKQEIINGLYPNITSYNIPEIEIFIHFWDTNIIKDETEEYLELQEIEYFFMNYLKEMNHSNYIKYFNTNILLDIILHYFKDLKYEKNKYFHGLKLINWNKKEELLNFKNNINMNKKITKKQLYNDYCKYKITKKENETIISKNYFTKFLHCK